MTEPSGREAGAILPGSTIGILGGGQLGRMMTIAAKRMGYRVLVLDPTLDCPAGQVADDQVVAVYDDIEAAQALARRSHVVTIEFENIPAATLEALEPLVFVRPSSRVAAIAQHRVKEKTFLAGHGYPVPRFRVVDSLEGLQEAISDIGLPAVLKAAMGGYDGKGQQRLDASHGLDTVWRAVGASEAVLEEFVRIEKEVSVVVARNLKGEVASYPVSENVHVNHILDTAVMPATVSAKLARQAEELARDIAATLEVVGLLAVEMFVAEDGRLLVNELAPRPHNSAHQTFDAAVTSQFEQAVRAVCNLPLGSPALLKPVAIANLLGDLWANGEPDWQAVLALPDVKLHLYGKAEPRPGRKMGHLAALGETPQEALQRVVEARARLSAGVPRPGLSR